jgi:hypothetical protein
MRTPWPSLVAALVSILTTPFVSSAIAAGPVVQVVEISGHRARFDNGNPAVVRYLLIDPANADPVVDGFPPLNTRAVLMLFTGGDGRLALAPGQQNIASPNFLVRARHHFAAEGYAVAVVDAASDFLVHNHPVENDAQGFSHASGLRGHRLPGRLHGDKHLLDLEAVMNNLRARYPTLPLWAVGTSRGTVSAALAGAAVTRPADGVVLTSSLTGPDPFEDLNGVNLAAINAPVLIATHQDDACANTHPNDSKALRSRFPGSPRVQVLLFNGGSAPLSDPCDPLSPHGYFGIEQRVIEAITRWIGSPGK